MTAASSSSVVVGQWCNAHFLSSQQRNWFSIFCCDVDTIYQKTEIRKRSGTIV